MSTEQVKLGSLINSVDEKDAVHVAVIPVCAGEMLMPGDHIGLSRKENGDYYVDKKSKNIGIVDPFLRKPVLYGQYFYMCLYPGTITSLRHNWTHPVFDELVDEDEKFLEGLASTIGVTKQTLIYAATRYVNHSDYYNMGENEHYRKITPAEWRRFWEIYKKKYHQDNEEFVTDNDYGFFSCSC